MSILDRIKRIARANINNVLDKADTPELALKEEIRKLEETTQDAKQALAQYAVSFKQLERDAEKLERARGDHQVNAESALKNGDEAGARRALAEKLKVEERLAALQPSLKQSRTTYEQLKDGLLALSDQLKTAKLRLAELESRKRAAEARRRFGAQLDTAQEKVDRDVSFSRMEEKVVATETEAEIQDEVRAELGGTDAERTREAREARVDSELEALKKKLKS